MHGSPGVEYVPAAQALHAAAPEASRTAAEPAAHEATATGNTCNGLEPGARGFARIMSGPEYPITTKTEVLLGVDRSETTAAGTCRAPALEIALIDVTASAWASIATRLGAMSVVDPIEKTTTPPEIDDAAAETGLPPVMGMFARMATLSGSATLTATTTGLEPLPKKARLLPTSNATLVRACTVENLVGSEPALLDKRKSAAETAGCVVSRLT